MSPGAARTSACATCGAGNPAPIRCNQQEFMNVRPRSISAVMPRSLIMATKSRKLSLKLRYQRTHRTTISWSKCRPLNNSSTATNRDICPSSPSPRGFAPEPRKRGRCKLPTLAASWPFRKSAVFTIDTSAERPDDSVLLGKLRQGRAGNSRRCLRRWCSIRQHENHNRTRLDRRLTRFTRCTVGPEGARTLNGKHYQARRRQTPYSGPDSKHERYQQSIVVHRKPPERRYVPGCDS
jgi:hypothetical protein